MTGRAFEQYAVKLLGEAGYWAHRIAPDESGQQPFDIIAIRDKWVYAYDAKVVSNGNRFPMSRVEDNQIESFEMIRKTATYCQAGLLIYHNGGIRFLSIDKILSLTLDGVPSIDVRELPIWRIA